MKKILCLTDFSKASVNAAKYAGWLARESNAKLTLLHVVQTHALLHGILSPEKARQVDEKLRQAAAELEKLRETLQKESGGLNEQFTCELLTGEGLLHDVTEYYCEQYDFDLVVAGTTGGSAESLDDLLIGSNTVELFDKMRWPVLSIPRNFHRHHLHRIVFATDYQQNDPEACKSVIEFAGPFCAQVHLLHVSPESNDAYESQMVNFAKTMVTGCGLERLHFSNITDPDIEHGVLSYAEEVEADLLVMTGKSTGFFERFFKQSLTELAAYHAQVPLLVFPALWKPGAQFFNRVAQTQNT